MTNLVQRFESHFGAQARGQLPFSRGFILVGDLPKARSKVGEKNHQTEALASISPALAAVEQARELVGATGGEMRHRKTKRAGKKRTYTRKKTSGGAKRRKTTPKKKGKRKGSRRPQKEAL